MDMKSTKCWSCANACTSGCSWSKDFTPVDGWNAVPVKYANGLESYEVIDCPDFVAEPEKHRIQDLDNVGCMILFEAALRQAREDYIKGERNTRRMVEDFIRNGYCMIDNPEGVIQALRKQAEGRLSREERRQRLMDMIKANPDMSYLQIAKALNEEPKYVWYWMDKVSNGAKPDIHDLDGVDSVVFVED